MKSPRILMISTHGYVSSHPDLGRPDTGGQVVYLLEMSKALAHYGLKIDILTRQFEGQPTIEYVSSGVRILRVPYAGDQFRPKETLANFVPELMRAWLKDSRLNHDDYSLISSHYWDAGVAGHRLSKITGIPHVHTPHSMGLLKRRNLVASGSVETLADNIEERIQQERRIYHRADLIISTAAEQTRCLNESDEYNVPGQKIAQLPPGFDDSLFYPPANCENSEAKNKLDWSSPTVFAAGRLAASKGYDLLLQAFPAVLKRIPDTQLVLAIGGPEPSTEERKILAQLKQLSKQLSLGKCVKFMSCVNQSRLADFYRAADVFVLCSRNEPFGMTAIESMACGTPTIVTTRGGLWEELTWGHDCIYCDPVDADALSQAICSPLLQPRIRQQLSQNGLATSRARYTWKMIAGQFVDYCVDRGWIENPIGIELAKNGSP